MCLRSRLELDECVGLRVGLLQSRIVVHAALGNSSRGQSDRRGTANISDDNIGPAPVRSLKSACQLSAHAHVGKISIFSFILIQR
jgi:hypothetical protein